METIESLDSLSFDSLFTAFNEAFCDYEMQVNHDELRVMLSRRGFDPSLSFGLFDNGRLVAFTLNGIGEYNGKKTAYDTGTGTIKAYRGRGFASRIFTESIPSLKDAGVSQYLLEVLQHNARAVSVYRKLGFGITREFNYFLQSGTLVTIPSKTLPASYRIAEVSMALRDKFTGFWEFTPSWQNGFESILRRRDDFIIIGAFCQEEIAGYCIFEPGSGDITQIAVSREHRRKGIASLLLGEALKHNRHSSVKAVNTEVSCESITAFLNACGIPLKGKQFEMIKRWR
ncbi:MAG: GNAT family N-acetyltransferase [Bacteroidales bacterium]|nr:GNAT family N-acetyltransferase [Bacteroidales bacterium]